MWVCVGGWVGERGEVEGRHTEASNDDLMTRLIFDLFEGPPFLC